MRDFVSSSIHNPELHAKDRPPLLGGERGFVHRGSRAVARLGTVYEADRTGFGHPPGMHHVDALIAKPLKHDWRTGGAADPHALQPAECLPLRLHPIQEPHPNRRHSGGNGHVLGRHQFVQACSVELGARQD